MEAFNQLAQYITQIAGDRVWLQRTSPPSLLRLPLFLKEKYQFVEADLFGRRLVLALEKEATSDATASDYARELQGLRHAIGGEVVLVLKPVLAHVRNRLIQQLVPFIIPGTQMFLPMMMIDLREQYLRRSTKVPERLSPVSQVIVLYHLLRHPLDQLPLAEIADRLAYSRMAISKAHEELERAQLCDVQRTGREVRLEFRGSKRTVWHAAEPILSSPVRKTYWVRKGINPPALLMAGPTALARVTMLADEKFPTFAIRDRLIKDLWRQGNLILVPGRDEAEERLEGWSYDPAILSNDGKTADPCSVYLSLRASVDERILKELKILMERTFA
jgi:DNA-binding MarR family transcriptional regulator